MSCIMVWMVMKFLMRIPNTATNSLPTYGLRFIGNPFIVIGKRLSGIISLHGDVFGHVCDFLLAEFAHHPSLGLLLVGYFYCNDNT